MERPVNGQIQDLPEQAGHNSRRDFLKRSAAAGALMWSAPAIMSLPAHAATIGSHLPAEDCCAANATGLIVRIPLLKMELVFDRGAEDPCVGTVDTGLQDLGTLGTVRVQATVVCAEEQSPEGGPCTASASIATLDVTGTAVLGKEVHAETLSSEARATCAPNCDTRGSSQITTLTVNGLAVNASGCNVGVQDILVVGEQDCEGELLTVNALHVNVPGVVEVIAAQSQAGAHDCPCVECR